MKNRVKLVFYNHPQRCDNISHTVSEKTNHHHNTIFRNNKLADNMWKIREYFHFILFLRRDWEAISKTRASGFIGVSKQSKTIKALGLRLRTFISFLVFGNPDETPALIFEIVHERFFPHMISLFIQHTPVSCRSSVPFRFKHDLKHQSKEIVTFFMKLRVSCSDSSWEKKEKFFIAVVQCAPFLHIRSFPI